MLFHSTTKFFETGGMYFAAFYSCFVLLIDNDYCQVTPLHTVDIITTTSLPNCISFGCVFSLYNNVERTAPLSHCVLIEKIATFRKLPRGGNFQQWNNTRMR